MTNPPDDSNDKIKLGSRLLNAAAKIDHLQLERTLLPPILLFLLFALFVPALLGGKIDSGLVNISLYFVTIISSFTFALSSSAFLAGLLGSPDQSKQCPLYKTKEALRFPILVVYFICVHILQQFALTLDYNVNTEYPTKAIRGVDLCNLALLVFTHIHLYFNESSYDLNTLAAGVNPSSPEFTHSIFDLYIVVMVTLKSITYCFREHKSAFKQR